MSSLDEPLPRISPSFNKDGTRRRNPISPTERPAVHFKAIVVINEKTRCPGSIFIPVSAKTMLPNSILDNDKLRPIVDPHAAPPVSKKVISGFQALRQARGQMDRARICVKRVGADVKAGSLFNVLQRPRLSLTEVSDENLDWTPRQSAGGGRNKTSPVSPCP
ncbi:hypothetical protein PoB_005775000 [Plakobranchus ocellatus]|uniref:Uncharacterized protein n=1 Tax=Plakobranchus ocellatus TaxID=259542 RepID=A0AAV4CI47_9GAST|nr:hypothetical protein PoB_005775000 [Plakobranchus ocellatus]